MLLLLFMDHSPTNERSILSGIAALQQTVILGRATKVPLASVRNTYHYRPPKWNVRENPGILLFEPLALSFDFPCPLL